MDVKARKLMKSCIQARNIKQGRLARELGISRNSLSLILGCKHDTTGWGTEAKVGEFCKLANLIPIEKWITDEEGYLSRIAKQVNALTKQELKKEVE